MTTTKRTTRRASAAAQGESGAGSAGNGSPVNGSPLKDGSPLKEKVRRAKPQTNPQTNPKKRHPHEDRLALIAKAAYFRSEHRGFQPGYELEDWLAAEAEVDQRKSRGGRASERR
jgi:hypothetical protein